jgi:hypothetical protein
MYPITTIRHGWWFHFHASAVPMLMVDAGPPVSVLCFVLERFTDKNNEPIVIVSRHFDFTPWSNKEHERLNK